MYTNFNRIISRSEIAGVDCAHLKSGHMQGKIEKLLQIEGDKGGLATKYNVRSWFRSWNRKEKTISRKNGDFELGL